MTATTRPSPVAHGPADVEQDSPAPRRGRPRDERVSQAIAAATLRQLREVGFARLSMESIAAEAGVARATLYRRYQDRADLVTAVIADQAETAPVGPGKDPRRDLVKFLAEFDRRFAESCLEVIGGLLGNREEPGALALHRHRVVAPRMAHARRLLVQAVEAGLVDPGADLDLGLEMLVGAVFTRRVVGIASRPGWAERAVDTVLAGMAPPGA